MKTNKSPLLKQFEEMKRKHPDAVLLFRVGDFYEIFCEDAVIASEILGIILTRRPDGIGKFVELAGFPRHALDTYLPKLVRAGKRVAICEGLEEPKKRINPTEIITPGLQHETPPMAAHPSHVLPSLHISLQLTFDF